MSDLDLIIARLRALPKSQQDALAAQIDALLEDETEPSLTDDQWARIEARLDSGESLTPHDEVVRTFRNR